MTVKLCSQHAAPVLQLNTLDALPLWLEKCLNKLFCYLLKALRQTCFRLEKSLKCQCYGYAFALCVGFGY